MATTRLPDINCLYGCFDALGIVTFADIPLDAGYYDGYCNSTIFATSLLSCGDQYCTPRQVTQGWKTFSRYCTLYSTAMLPAPTIEIVRNELVGVTPDSFDCLGLAGTQVNSTILPDEASFQAGVDTEDTWGNEMIMHHAFGWTMYVLMALVVAFGVINHISQYVRPMSDRPETAPSDTVASHLYTLYQKYIATPALFGHRHVTPWGWLSIPTRIQAIMIFLYVMINLVCTLVGYKLFDDNLYWRHDTASQLWRYVADRTGIMAFYNLPLLWALAGRNDVFLWITGWDYASMNLFHRWVARVATAQAIIHSAAYTWLERTALAEEFSQQYWRMGVVATIAMSLLVFPLSSLPVRKRMYEVFPITHIVFALVCLVALFYHVLIWDHEYDPWLWVCVGLWVFDRLVRVLRFIILSGKAVFHRHNTLATVHHGGLIRLRVETSLKINPSPGQYYFLYFPQSYTPWENHPFTLASWRENKSTTTLDFYFAPHKGATRRLERRLVKKDTLPVLLEGPYGHTQPVKRFDHALFVAGGSGITAILPYLSQVDSNSVTRRITVIWAIKHPEYLVRDIHDLLKVHHQTELVIRIHVTRELGAAVADVVPALTGGEEPDLAGKNSEMEVGDTNLIPGRPDMFSAVREALGQLVGSERLAVLGCGPGGMMDDLRSAVTASYGNTAEGLSGNRVQYFEEFFGW